MFNLFCRGLKGWLYMSDQERHLNDVVENGLAMPPECIQVATDWHSGQGSMLYAIASTGEIRRGTDRPRTDDDENRPMTDHEWMLHLIECAASEFRDVKRFASAGDLHDDAMVADRCLSILDAHADGLRELIEAY